MLATSLIDWADLAPQVVVALVIVGAAAALVRLLHPRDLVTRGEFLQLRTEFKDQDVLLNSMATTLARIDERTKPKSRRSHSEHP